jgi:hypothetical protein
LLPGASITIVTRFRVIGITDRTINRAYVQDAIGEGGRSGGSGPGEGGGTTTGGQVVLEKALAPGTTPESGRPLTFIISLRNDGAADIVKAPVQDTYTADYLQFWRASIPPSSVTPGELRWDDVLPLLGLTRLRPNEVVTFTVEFTALKSIDAGALNSAGAAGVQDEFQNQLPAPRRAEVPIRIVAGPGEATPTAQPRPTPKPRSESQPTATPEIPTPETPTAAPTAAALITATVEVPTPTSESAGAAAPTVVPARLPRTGGADMVMSWPLVAIALIVGGALALRHRRVN